MPEIMPRVVASRSVERVLKLAQQLIEDVPTDAMEQSWNDRGEVTVSDLEEILKHVSFGSDYA